MELSAIGYQPSVFGRRAKTQPTSRVGYTEGIVFDTTRLIEPQGKFKRMEKIRLGYIGCGFMAQKVHIQILRAFQTVNSLGSQRSERSSGKKSRVVSVFPNFIVTTVNSHRMPILKRSRYLPTSHYKVKSRGISF